MDNDQSEWRSLFLSEIRELRSDMKKLREENREILESVTTLKVKASLFITLIGGLAGILGESIRKKLGL